MFFAPVIIVTAVSLIKYMICMYTVKNEYVRNLNNNAGPPNLIG